MVKTLTILFAGLLLIGCADTVRVRTDVQEVFVPVLYCPAPPEISRPPLPIHDMTDEQEKKDGEVVKHYKATVKILQGYSKELETALDEYKNTSEAYKELEANLIKKLESGQLEPPVKVEGK